jgi:hypothetical protein
MHRHTPGPERLRALRCCSQTTAPTADEPRSSRTSLSLLVRNSHNAPSTLPSRAAPLGHTRSRCGPRITYLCEHECGSRPARPDEPARRQSGVWLRVGPTGAGPTRSRFELSPHHEAGAGGDCRRWPSVDGADDLAAVDALQVDAGDAEVRVLDMRVIWRLCPGSRSWAVSVAGWHPGWRRGGRGAEVAWRAAGAERLPRARRPAGVRSFRLGSVVFEGGAVR